LRRRRTAALTGGAVGPPPTTNEQRAVPTSGVEQAMAKDTQFSINPQPDDPRAGAQHPPAEGARHPADEGDPHAAPAAPPPPAGAAQAHAPDAADLDVLDTLVAGQAPGAAGPGSGSNVSSAVDYGANLPPAEMASSGVDLFDPGHVDSSLFGSDVSGPV